MLPNFKYHPAPINTGSIEKSDEICECCNRNRGYVYTSSVYAVEDVEFICPWCIADGSVHQKYDAELIDSYSLLEEGLSEDIIQEVCCRTPGYISWQSEVWLTCCNDACEFHGDVSKLEMQTISADRLEQLSQDSDFAIGDLKEMIKHYQPKSSPAFYKFVCLHCSQVKYHMDFS